MAPIVLIGTDAPLLEGIAQTLGAAGHRTKIARAAEEVVPRQGEDAPLVVIAERALALRDDDTCAALLRIPLAPGGAMLLYRAGAAAAPKAEGAEPPLPAPLRRVTLAELTLPLERHRLVALVNSIEERARRTGRGNRVQTPPENRAI
jgi:hypothetical protein